MATSVVSNLDSSLLESIRRAQRQALYLQCATKKPAHLPALWQKKQTTKIALAQQQIDT